jgi:hypothetical protein
MRKQMYIYFAVASVMLLTLLSSCLDTDGENSQTFAYEPLIVEGQVGAYTVVNSRYVNSPQFYAPGLNGKVSANDCLLASFKIDFDNQPAGEKCYVITEMFYEVLAKSVASAAVDTFSAEYSDAIYGMEFLSTNGAPVLIKNVLFAAFDQRSDQGSTFSYRIVWKEETPSAEAAATEAATHPTLYINAKAEGNKAGSVDRVAFCAFDITDFLNDCAERYPSATKQTIDVKYQTQIPDSTGLVFEKIASFPVTFSQSE